MSEQTQIKWLLNAATSVFEAHSDSASLDAELLMCHVLDCNRTYLFTWSDKVLDENQIDAFETLVKRRENGEPIAHIIGYKEFWSLKLAVNPSTLIPRPDTETLVELALDIANKKNTNSGNGLDLGTGTGAIALALASELPNWQWIGAEFSEDALALAKHNAKENNINNGLFIQSDWFSHVPVQKFDLIVSNPPYIDPEDEHLQQGDVRFEPLSALIAPQKGLADIKIIVENSIGYLDVNGALLIEHGFDQGQSVRDIFCQNNFHNVETFKDLGGNDRVTVGYFK
jgi:release factor glutamine methyltransferase